MNRVPLSSIPTLRQLYTSKSIISKSGQLPLYSSLDDVLDRVSLIQGDITELEVDAIVNAANKTLLGGGGVDGAIHRAAGKQLLQECESLNGCDTGDAKITNGYYLPAKYVIHTVGPIYSSRSAGQKAIQLASCYKRSLTVAVNNSLKTIAFCSISTGVYGYPIEDATNIALNEIRKFLESEKGSILERVIFTVFSDEDKSVYETLLPLYFPETK
ncbi:A1pp-domain-containing [Pyrrhoderma noxium]|uniref:A1pp-domain-containing n=1 Tax=Pyrrhoderma noxium TaxID=2282107 RepID=A0A286U9Z4_9AGAM|nr:A1pp-domain-containing [Pyrrhoderma noxium]